MVKITLYVWSSVWSTKYQRYVFGLTWRPIRTLDLGNFTYEELKEWVRRVGNQQPYIWFKTKIHYHLPYDKINNRPRNVDKYWEVNGNIWETNMNVIRLGIKVKGYKKT